MKGSIIDSKSSRFDPEGSLLSGGGIREMLHAGWAAGTWRKQSSLTSVWLMNMVSSWSMGASSSANHVCGEEWNRGWGAVCGPAIGKNGECLCLLSKLGGEGAFIFILDCKALFTFKYCWYITSYEFQVGNIVIWHLYTLQHNHHKKSSIHPSPCGHGGVIGCTPSAVLDAPPPHCDLRYNSKFVSQPPSPLCPSPPPFWQLLVFPYTSLFCLLICLVF